MKSNKKLHLVSLAAVTLILFLILVSSTALGATLTNPSLTITKTRITTSGSAEYPEIYGDNIVWQDNRSGNWDIYMYNLSTKKETQITTNKSAQTNPVIYADKVVWLDMRNGEDTNDFNYGGQDVYMYNLSSKKETRITANTFEINPDSPTALDIYDNMIMWSKGSGFTIYNVSTKKETYTETSSVYYPVLYGNTVVWKTEMNSDEGGNMCMYNTSTKKETEIVTSNSAGRPAIYGDRIAWADARSSNNWPYINWNIYMYDISTKKETQITTSGSAGDPVIYGDKILWVDVLSGDWKVYLYNISTNTETPTTNISASIDAIYGDKIVWTDWDNGKTDIYLGTLISSNLPIAAFSASPTSGNAPLKVQFTDKSIGSPAYWKWGFGDGTTSKTKNPTHKYSKAGKYTVTLKVTNAAGINTATKSKYITVTAKPVAAFSASPTSGKSPLNVKFTDKSTGTPTKWKWDFGDGSKSFLQNPTHKYSKAGKYTVTLKVTNAAGINTATKSNYITVTGTSQAPTADFWGWPLSGKAPLKVTFTETSKGSPTSWKWDFGDGKYSTEKSPTHIYSTAGTYTVKLTATNTAGSSTKLKWKYIKVAK